MKGINPKGFFIIFFPTFFLAFVSWCLKYQPFGDFIILAAIPISVGLFYWWHLASPILFAAEIKIEKKVDKVSK